MLELRPVCENCNKPLPPQAVDAMICSFECTFCAECVRTVISNVCPNCGGGFAPRPIRPRTNWKNDNFVGRYPATTDVRHRPVSKAEHKAFASKISVIPPADR